MNGKINNRHFDPLPVGVRKSWIERLAERLRIIPSVETPPSGLALPKMLEAYPPFENWDEVLEEESRGWPAKETKKRMLIPTICFNCESACGLLAVVDHETGDIDRFEGNPLHPASRGRLCPKGPATLNQTQDADRVLRPMRRTGKRGEGQWKSATWDEALDDIAGRIRQAIVEDRRQEIMYHVGRPGAEGYMERVLGAWGVDGHNSHTNVCSAAARLGYMLWWGADRPSPDYANAKMILLLSSHLEAGHYFNPHAQRILEGIESGAKMAVMDTRLSNTASKATWWLPTQPGTESTALLAMAHILLEEDLFNREFVENWVNWKETLRNLAPERPVEFDQFVEYLRELYAEFTPERAEEETGVSAGKIREVALAIGEAGPAFSAHIWRNSASGHLGGWQVARNLHFLSVLVGAISTEGGTWPNSAHKFGPTLPHKPDPVPFWNELVYPREFPLTHYEVSQLLPYFLLEGRGTLSVYFTRVFNPVWTYPDGFSWVEALRDESKVGCHVALTPTWNESAFFADWVLPMGHSPERHDLCSYETHRSVWIAFRQPVRREWSRRMESDKKKRDETRTTRDSNPGDVWEEDEFWIELSWRIDPDGSLGIRKHFEAPDEPGRKMTVDDYYTSIFENVPGLKEEAAKHSLSPLEYMRRVGAFEVKKDNPPSHLSPIPEADQVGSEVDADSGIVSRDGKIVGIEINGEKVSGFPTPSRRLEFFSETLSDWSWPEHAVPGAISSHVSEENLDRSKGEMGLLPTFRLPNLIHSRSGNAKWLIEIAQRNPIWVHPKDATRVGISTGDLVRVETEIGYFVDRAWVTEGIKPGVVACSHHIGRWRRPGDPRGNRFATSVVDLREEQAGKWRMRRISEVTPFKSRDPDSKRIFWREGGVPQNLTHAVHPDPVSAMHAWHQKVRLTRAGKDDRAGDVSVDTGQSMKVYREWMSRTRPAPGPGGLRRPTWLKRPLAAKKETYFLDKD